MWKQDTCGFQAPRRIDCREEGCPEPHGMFLNCWDRGQRGSPADRLEILLQNSRQGLHKTSNSLYSSLSAPLSGPWHPPVPGFNPMSSLHSTFTSPIYYSHTPILAQWLWACIDRSCSTNHSAKLPRTAWKAALLKIYTVDHKEPFEWLFRKKKKQNSTINDTDWRGWTGMKELEGKFSRGITATWGQGQRRQSQSQWSVFASKWVDEGTEEGIGDRRTGRGVSDTQGLSAVLGVLLIILTCKLIAWKNMSYFWTFESQNLPGV